MYVRQRYIHLVELLQYTIPPPPASTINRVRSERIIKQVLKQFVARAYPVSLNWLISTYWVLIFGEFNANPIFIITKKLAECFSVESHSASSFLFQAMPLVAVP